MNSHGIGPLMSEALPIAIFLSEMPVPFLNPAHDPAVVPEAAGG